MEKSLAVGFIASYGARTLTQHRYRDMANVQNIGDRDRDTAYKYIINMTKF